MSQYRYTESDFVMVPVEEIKVNDEMAWGMHAPDGKHYAALRIKKIHNGAKRCFDLEILPGVNAVNVEWQDLEVEWDDDKPVITASVYRDRDDVAMIRRSFDRAFDAWADEAERLKASE